MQKNKVIAAAVTAAMVFSSLPTVFGAENDVKHLSVTVDGEVQGIYYPSRDVSAVLFGEDDSAAEDTNTDDNANNEDGTTNTDDNANEGDSVYSALVSGVENQLDPTAQTQDITIDNLARFNIPLTLTDDNKYSEDCSGIVDSCIALIYSYNILSVDLAAEVPEDGETSILTSVTFHIDNTDTVDDIVSTIVDKAAARLDSENGFDDTAAVFSYDDEQPFTQGFLLKNEDEIMARIQAKRPELCYILSSRTLGNTYITNAIGSNISSITIGTKVSIPYLDITLDEYNAFENKLDQIINDTISADMNDVDKALALHDWIVDNVKYGYKVSKDVLEKYAAEEQSIPEDGIVVTDLYEFWTFEEAIGSTDGEAEMAAIESESQKAHTAYGPAMEGYGVCQGYSMLYSALLDKVGIENGTVTNDDLSHQWTLIKLDGKWYHADATWDDATVPDFNTIALSNGLELNYMANDYRTYEYFLASTDLFSDDFGGSIYELNESAEGKHFDISGNPGLYIAYDEDGNSVSDIECNDSQYHAVTADEKPVYAISYVYGDDYYSYKGELTYADGSYYYNKIIEYSDGSAVTTYYKMPFILYDGESYTEPVEITAEEYEAALTKKIHTVEIPDEDVINNSVSVTYSIKDSDEDEPSVDNIGTLGITITADEDAESPVSSVDAYLVYYGESGEVISATPKTVSVTSDGAFIGFDTEKPDDAVSAKIIILDSGADLQPVIKAIASPIVNSKTEAEPDVAVDVEPAA